ncbi:Beta-lactamase-like protein 2 [Naganishia albida]|nr:Beta-lactamase-like protein 2 [Naganishia albida]
MLNRWNTRIESLGLYIWNYFYNMTTRLSALANIERLSARVVRVLGQNPGQMTLQGTNCYIVHAPDTDPRDYHSSRICLIDTGAAWPTSSSFLPLLRESIAPFADPTEREAKPDAITAITDIILTHRHADHVGGLKPILEVFNKSGLPQPRVHKYPHPIEKHSNGTDVDWDELLVQEVWPGTTKSASSINWLKDNDRIPLQEANPEQEGTTLRIISTPGHTPDSISLILEETSEVFTADTVLGQGTSVFTDLTEYMASLQKLLELQPSTIYPGHGPHTDGRAPAIAKIEEYITHRLDRETQIVHALEKLTSEAESSKTGITTRQIVEVIYAGLGIGVYMAADKPVTAHLVKLERDGRVSRDSIGNWRLLQSSGQ